MILRIAFLCLYFPLASLSKAQTVQPVYISGTDGHKSYRIPAIIKAGNKELLAFCEGRVNGAGDFGDINIVMKRSVDGGLTWSAISTVVDADSLQAGNPAPVVDLTDPAWPGGRIFLFYKTGNSHKGEIRNGKGLREAWYITSVDNGRSWSKAVNITSQVHRPDQPELNAMYNFKEDVSISNDGGRTWDSTWFDRTLVDPVNEGSIIGLGSKTIAFYNAADEKRRDNLTLRISYDEGRTWTKHIVVDQSNDNRARDFTAYSDLVPLTGNTIGVLYERDNYKQIVFLSIRWK